MMSRAAELKTGLQAFIAEQRRALAAGEAAWQVEKDRLTTQITNAEAVLAQWDRRVETLIDTLASAGIRLKTE